LNDLERQKYLIESLASQLEYEAAQRARLSAESEVRQFEEGEKQRQLRAVIEWLSPADFRADQESATSARTNKDSGQWLLKDEKMSAMCNPESTALKSLWLVGAPGVGALQSLYAFAFIL
jgi:hypothetical protein